MEKLNKQLKDLVCQLDEVQKNDILQKLANQNRCYPFDEFQYLFASLMGCGKITQDDYLRMSDEYCARNLYLPIFEINAPTTFGAWAADRLIIIAPALIKPTKGLYRDYLGEYDLLLDGCIKIEVKASRAVDFDSSEALYVKALSSDSNKRFDMNFQQLKPACCDVFVWVGVWRDVIRYWVLASKDVAVNRHYSPQHRDSVGEGQIHIKENNIAEFSLFEVKPRALIDEIRRAHERQINA